MDDEKKVDPIRFTESANLKKLREMIDASKMRIAQDMGVHDSMVFDIESHALDAIGYLQAGGGDVQVGGGGGGSAAMKHISAKVWAGTLTRRMTAASVLAQQMPKSWFAQPHTIMRTPADEGLALFEKTAESVYATINDSARQFRRRYGAECLHRKTQARLRISKAYDEKHGGHEELGLQRVAKEQAALLLWLNEIMNEKRR